jgi:hypothetical protein
MTSAQRGKFGNHCNIPKAFSTVQSDVFKSRKARAKLMTMVVRVKKKLGKACRHFL